MMTDRNNARARAPFSDTTFPGLVSIAAGLAMWIWGRGEGLAFGFLLVFLAVGAGIYCISVSKALRSDAQALGWIGNVLAGTWLLQAGIGIGQAS